MKTKNLTFLVCSILLLSMKFVLGQQLEANVSYDLKTTTNYLIDECSYSIVGEIEPYEWVDKTNTELTTHVEINYYDDCTWIKETTIIEHKNIFLDWATPPALFRIDPDHVTAFDADGNILTQNERHEKTKSLDPYICESYMIKYDQDPGFSDGYMNLLLQSGFEYYPISNYEYMLVHPNHTIYINDKDFEVTHTEYENGALIKQNFIKSDSDGDHTVMDDDKVCVVDTTDSGIVYTEVIVNDYENYTVTEYKGTKERSKDQALGMMISPNPSSETLHIHYEYPQALDLRLISISGVEIMRVSNFKEKVELDVSQLPAGMYFLQYQLDKKWQSHKIIIE